MTFGSLHKAAASSSIWAPCLNFCLRSWFFSASGSRAPPGPASIIRCLAGGRGDSDTVLNASARAHWQPVSLVLIRPARPLFRRGQKISSAQTSLSFVALVLVWLHAAMVSKWVPSFQIRPRSTASLRATATRARLAPRFLISRRPQLFKAERFLTVVSKTLAAS